MNDNFEAQEIAAKITASGAWDIDACEELCKLAGLGEEWDEADDYTYEDVVIEAAERLGVEIRKQNCFYPIDRTIKTDFHGPTLGAEFYLREDGKSDVSYLGSEDGDYMLTEVEIPDEDGEMEDVVLYAIVENPTWNEKLEEYDDEVATYAELKESIIEQAQENGIDPQRLSFWFDD